MPAAEDAVAAWEALFRTQAALVRRFGAEDVWGPISLREYDVLHTLTRCGGGAARLGELTDAVLLPQPSLSRLVDRLEAKALVTRTAHPTDGRGVLVAITADGREVTHRVGRRHAASIAAAMGVLDGEQLATLRALCAQVLAAQQ